MARQSDEPQSVTYTVFSVFPSARGERTITIPGTRMAFRFGGSNIAWLRKRAERKPDDWRARTSLAANLISRPPVSRESAEEAAEHFRAALQLLQSNEPSVRAARAMVHKLLGDTLLELGEIEEAREQWQQAVDVDPVRPPDGYSGAALAQLDNHRAG